MANVQIFLSAASDEFRQYRIDLRNDLDRHNVNVKIQDYLTRTGRGTMLMLDDGIQPCEAVIHLVGDKPGQCPSEEELGELRHRYSDLDKHPVLGRLILGAEQCTYTQWEAYMAIYHGKDLYIATRSAIPKGSQAEHRKRLLSLGRHPDIAGFDDYKDLLTKLLKTTLVDILAKAEKPRQRPPHLPPPRDLVGRSELLARIRETLPPESASDPSVSVRVLAGLGGVGKTSLAIGYAMQFADSYTTRALISSSSPQEFRRSLADLALSGTIDAVGAVTQNEEQRRHVVLDCLRHKKYRPWLLILDNVDTKEARDEIIGQLSQFQGGHILVTSRLRDWKAPARVLHVDVLSLPDAADLLLTRTDDWRTKEPDDDKAARELAGELGRLPLALDQASAYIETHEIGLREYLRRWRSHQPDVQKWFPADSNVPQEAVVTWQTSIDQLDKAAEVLLWLLAWLAPGPLPAQALTLDSSVAAWDRCVQHCIPNYATSQADGAHTTGLERMQSAGKLLVNLSLVSRDNTAPTPTISMHQVVREIIHTSVATLRPDCAAGLRDAASAIVEAALGRTEWIPYLSAHADALAEAGGTFEEFPLLEDHIAGMAVLKGLHDGSWETLVFGGESATYKAMHNLESPEELAKLERRLAAIVSVCGQEYGRLVFACVHLVLHYWWDCYIAGTPLDPDSVAEYPAAVHVSNPLLDIWERINTDEPDRTLVATLRRFQNSYPRCCEYRARTAGRPEVVARWNDSGRALMDLREQLGVASSAAENTSAHRFIRAISNVNLAECLRYGDELPGYGPPASQTALQLYEEAQQLFAENKDEFHHIWSQWETMDCCVEVCQRMLNEELDDQKGVDRLQSMAGDLCRAAMGQAIDRATKSPNEDKSDDEDENEPDAVDAEVLANLFSTEATRLGLTMPNDALAHGNRLAAVYCAYASLLGEEDAYGMALYQEHRNRGIDWILMLAQTDIADALSFGDLAIKLRGKVSGKLTSGTSVSALSSALRSAITARDRKTIGDVLFPPVPQLIPGSDGDHAFAADDRKSMKSFFSALPLRLSRLSGFPVAEQFPSVARIIKKQLADTD